MKRLTPRALLIVALAALSGGCPGDSSEPTLKRAREAGVVRVGFANEAPFAYLDPTTGELTGEAPAIAQVVFERLGVAKIEGVLTEFGSLIPGLKAGRFDVIAAGMYVTPARCKEVAFSEPSYCISDAFAVARGNPLDLHSYEDVLRHPSARIGVVAGTVELTYARRLGLPEGRTAIFPDAPGAIDALRGGRIDAFAGTRLTVDDLVEKVGRSEVERTRPFEDPVIDGQTVRGCGAFAFRKDDTALLEDFNRELAKLVGSVEHRALVRPFGFTEEDLPGGVSTAALCGE